MRAQAGALPTLTTTILAELGVAGDKMPWPSVVKGALKVLQKTPTTTLSKALGSQGGAVLGSAAVRDHLIDSARPFIFDTGLAPAAVGAARAALRVLCKEPWRPQTVLANARTLAEICDVPETPESAVVSVILGDPDAAVAAATACLRAGVRAVSYTPLMLPTILPLSYPLRALELNKKK